MKTQSVGLAAHRQLGTTTLAWLWLVQRTDEEFFAFTNIDRDVELIGHTFKAATGLTPSAVQGRPDLSVQNMEIVGALDAASITEDDLLAGKWDNAAIWVGEANYADLSQGYMLINYGTLGNVKAGRVAFTAELRGLSQALQQPIGRVFSADCNAIFGDARCGVDAEATRRNAEVSSVLGAIGLGSDLTGDLDQSGAGLLRWETGLNAGIQVEINSDDGAGNLTLCYPMPKVIQVGDTFSVVDGCRKRFTDDCKNKHNNVINFRGFPHVPGNAVVIGNAGLETTNG